ncbi:MAG: hypothetical protein R6V12_07215 [Candidatus Hydrogenedentota bacterium]
MTNLFLLHKSLLAIVGAATIFISALGFAGENSPVLRFDFETGDLQGWRIIEGAFDLLVCDRAEFHNTQQPYNKQGKYFLSTLEQSDYRPNDGFTGVIESPVFKLQAPEMTLLVGGGKHPDTYIALCTLDGHEHCHARGENTETMAERSWHKPELVGQQCFLRIVDQNQGGWGHITFDNFVAGGVIDEEATAERFAQIERARFRKSIAEELDACAVEPLQDAVRYLTEKYADSYANGRQFLREIDELAAKIHRIRETPAREEMLEQAKKVRGGFQDLKRRALLANPLVCSHPILFVARKQYRSDHHNTATIFQVGEINEASFEGGGALKTIDVAKDGQVRTLLEAPEGIIRDPEVYFDASRIVFSMRNDQNDDYHIYEINADGSGLKQLTFAERVSDIDPLYLPDDSIAFSSTREPKYCMCNRHIMANLFRMGADGANIHQIGKSTLFEGHGALTPDGRILYDRWEYVDRNFGDAQGLWTVNPDGTNHALYWGNNTWSPGAVLDARIIPATQRAICVFSSCHDRPWGALAIIDRRLGMDNRRPVVRTWPASAIDLVGPGNPAKPDHYGFDNFKQVSLKYEDPYPLDENFFLCSRMVGRGELMGIFLIDTFGNELLLHVEEPGCFDPMPLAPRERPQVIPPRRTFENAPGALYVMDVCEGTHMEGLERGAVKYLRVVESPEKRFWTSPSWNGQGQEAPAMHWHDFLNKRILGTVPVEPDGSAYFQVPADKFVYFQLLDERGMMIQSMRSGTMVQSGECTGCIGCHEERRQAPHPLPGKAPVPLAVRKEPRPLTGWQGGQELFNYLRDVQPVFDRYCIECHDYGKKGGNKLLLCGDKTLTFNTSYNELWRKGYIKAVGGGPAHIQQAYSWGSHSSPLVQTILKGHHDIEMDPASFDRLVTWIDVNAPYYPVYSSAYPNTLAGRSPLDNDQLKRLEELTAIPFGKLADCRTNRGPQVSFDRPERSPCLQELDGPDGPRYREALSIIQAGGQQLKRIPRGDMPGYSPCETDAARQERYTRRAEEEQRMRQALHNGQHAYDPGAKP